MLLRRKSFYEAVGGHFKEDYSLYLNSIDLYFLMKLMLMNIDVSKLSVQLQNDFFKNSDDL